MGTGFRMTLNPAWGSKAMGRGCKRCGAAGAGSASLSSLGIGVRRCSLWKSLGHLGLCAFVPGGAAQAPSCSVLATLGGVGCRTPIRYTLFVCTRFGSRERAPRRSTCGCGRCLPVYSAQIPCLCARASVSWVGTGQCGISTLRKGKVAAHRVEDGCGAPATLALGRHSVDQWCSATHP